MQNFTTIGQVKVSGQYQTRFFLFSRKNIREWGGYLKCMSCILIHFSGKVTPHDNIVAICHKTCFDCLIVQGQSEIVVCIQIILH